MLESDENSRLHRRTIIWELVLCFCVGNLESLNRIMSAMNGWLELGRSGDRSLCCAGKLFAMPAQNSRCVRNDLIGPDPLEDKFYAPRGWKHLDG